jgi:hypothetical protein
MYYLDKNILQFSGNKPEDFEHIIYLDSTLNWDESNGLSHGELIGEHIS